MLQRLVHMLRIKFELKQKVYKRNESKLEGFSERMCMRGLSMEEYEEICSDRSVCMFFYGMLYFKMWESFWTYSENIKGGRMSGHWSFGVSDICLLGQSRIYSSLFLKLMNIPYVSELSCMCIHNKWMWSKFNGQNGFLEAVLQNKEKW